MGMVIMTYRVGSDVLPRKQNLLAVDPLGKLKRERKLLGASALSASVVSPLGIVRIGRHGRVGARGHVRMDEILDEVEFVALELLRGGTFRGVRVVHDASADLHVAVVMGIEVAVNYHDSPLVVRALGNPRHRIAGLVEPASPSLVVVTWGLSANARVGVEAMMAVLAGRAACLAYTFARGEDVVRVEVTRAGSLYRDGLILLMYSYEV